MTGPDIVDVGAQETCAYVGNPPTYDGLVCERKAGHYPATPHAAFLDGFHRSPIYWNDRGQETDRECVVLDHYKPTPPLNRADVEAKQAQNDAILKMLAARKVGVASGDLLMTYVALAVERLFGDMDDQRRLELENAYADLARRRLEATMSAVDRDMLTHGITPSGLHLPNGGSS